MIRGVRVFSAVLDSFPLSFLPVLSDFVGLALSSCTLINELFAAHWFSDDAFDDVIMLLVNDPVRNILATRK